MSPEHTEPQRLLLISGSTRAMSTNSAFCGTAVDLTPAGATAEIYTGMASLPHFNPDDDRDPLPTEVADLRAAIAASDAVLFCTPEYAGTLPGSFKNLLDWTVGGTVLNDKPVAWARVAEDPNRGGGAHATLATVLGYVQATVVDDACRHVPIGRSIVDADGLVTDAKTRDAIADLIATLLRSAHVAT